MPSSRTWSSTSTSSSTSSNRAARRSRKISHFLTDIDSLAGYFDPHPDAHHWRTDDGCSNTSPNVSDRRASKPRAARSPCLAARQFDSDPGLNFRIGVDALLGLIPGIGDAIGVLVSSYILREAAQLGAPKTVLFRMAFNVVVEGVIGMIPLAGDVFDAAWKANQRNVRLLGAYLDNPRKTTSASTGFVFVLAVVVIGLLIATGVAGFLLLRWIVQAIGA